ncbi:MAG TPA: hypothetical protein VI431_05120 [Candidatus Acidoferrum sp.]
MDCLTVNREELAEQYLQGKLDSARQDEFETHLLECSQCARELELLQTVRAQLSERAHEIRGWTGRKAFFFRLQAVAFAALLVMMIAGSIAIRQRKQNNAIAVLAPPDTNRPPTQTAAPENTTAASTKPTAPGGIPEPTQHAKKTEVVSATKPEKIGNLPVNARNSINFTIADSQVARDAAPSIGPAPTSSPASSAGANANGKGAPESAPGAQPVPVQVAEEKPKSALPSDDPREKPELTTPQGVELARIGMVEPPPYTFPGMVSHFMSPMDHKKPGFAKDQGSQGGGRELFRKGMNEYVGGHYSEAAGYLEQAVPLEPRAADINFYLGICKLLLGHPDESILPLKNAVGAGKSIYLQPSHYYLAKAYVQGNKLGDAEEELRKAIAVPGRLTSDAKGLLARLQTLRGQIEKP